MHDARVDSNDGSSGKTGLSRALQRSSDSEELDEELLESWMPRQRAVGSRPISPTLKVVASANEDWRLLHSAASFPAT